MKMPPEIPYLFQLWAMNYCSIFSIPYYRLDGGIVINYKGRCWIGNRIDFDTYMRLCNAK